MASSSRRWAPNLSATPCWIRLHTTRDQDKNEGQGVLLGEEPWGPVRELYSAGFVYPEVGFTSFLVHR